MIAFSKDPKSGFYLFAICLLLVIGFFLRLPRLSNPELHVDESLYADVTRHVVEHRDLLVNGARSDKPPMLYWLQAPFFCLFGPSAITARIPGLLAWLITGIVIWVALSKAWGNISGLMALVLWSLSPYGIVFTPTGFTDPIMAAFGTCGLALLLADRPLESGILIGLSTASKQTGLFYLVLALAILMRDGKLKIFVRGYLWVFVPLLIWSIFLGDPKFGIWTRTVEYASGQASLGLIDRSKVILDNLWNFGGGLWANVFIALSLFLGLISGSKARVGWLAAWSTAAYLCFLAHGNFYDRYLLWMLGPLALACAAGIRSVPEKIQLPAVIALGLLLMFNWNAIGSSLGDGASTQGFQKAQMFSNENFGKDDTIFLLGKVQDDGWKALFYFHPQYGQGIRLQGIAGFDQARTPGWVLGLDDAVCPDKPVFDSQEGLKIWKVRVSS